MKIKIKGSILTVKMADVTATIIDGKIVLTGRKTGQIQYSVNNGEYNNYTRPLALSFSSLIRAKIGNGDVSSFVYINDNVRKTKVGTNTAIINNEKSYVSGSGSLEVYAVQQDKYYMLVGPKWASNSGKAELAFIRSYSDGADIADTDIIRVLSDTDIPDNNSITDNCYIFKPNSGENYVAINQKSNAQNIAGDKLALYEIEDIDLSFRENANCLVLDPNSWENGYIDETGAVSDPSSPYKQIVIPNDNYRRITGFIYSGNNNVSAVLFEDANGTIISRYSFNTSTTYKSLVDMEIPDGTVNIKLSARVDKFDASILFVALLKY